MRSIFTHISVCTICKEYISWICGKYERMDYVTHSDTFCGVHTKSRSDIKKLKLNNYQDRFLYCYTKRLH